MYNEELDRLIEFALADGVLTEKEKAILVKKARTLGIDEEELEMVLDAKLHKLKSSQVKSTNLRCSYCNEILSSFNNICPSCKRVNEQVAQQNDKSELAREIKEVEYLILDLKTLPSRKSSLIRINYWLIAVIYVSLVFAAIAIGSWEDWYYFGTVFIGFCGLCIVGMDYMKIKEDQKEESLPLTYEEIQGRFKKDIRNLNILFGDNERTKMIIKDLEMTFYEEIENQQKLKRERRKFIVILILILLFSLIGWFFLAENYI